MSPFINWEDIPEKEIVKGFHGKLVHLQGMTFARWRVEKGSSLPFHHHPHEQISYVLEGEFEMTVGEETQICQNNNPVLIPSEVPHKGVAHTDCVILDVFQPVREDYK